MIAAPAGKQLRPGGRLRWDPSTRGITCTDPDARASFIIGDYKVIIVNGDSRETH